MGPNQKTDCEVHITPSTCSNKVHDGKVCMWSSTKHECIEASPGDLEHVCDKFGSSEQCATKTGCGWYVSEQKCVQFSDLPQVIPNQDPSGRGQLISGDCELYFTPTQCKGKMHDGKACMWSATKGECLESSAGDMEHVCDQFATTNECGTVTGCGWDFMEHKCVQLSDLGYLPPGQLATAHCTSIQDLEECHNDSTCAWDAVSIGCAPGKKLNSLHQTLPSGSEPSLLSQCIVPFSLSFFSTIFAFSAYLYCNKRPHRTEEHIEDVYTRVDMDSLA